MQSYRERNPIYAVLNAPFPVAESATRASLPQEGTPEAARVETTGDPQGRVSESVNMKSVAAREELSVSNPAPSASTRETDASVPGLPPAPAYLFGVGLHRQPKLLNEISVDYPDAAGAQEGKVVLRILVSETGSIDNLAVMRADPAGFFEDAALSAFAQAQFSPGEFLGIAVKSQFLVEVDFVPINRVRTSGKGY